MLVSGHLPAVGLGAAHRAHRECAVRRKRWGQNCCRHYILALLCLWRILGMPGQNCRSDTSQDCSGPPRSSQAQRVEASRLRQGRANVPIGRPACRSKNELVTSSPRGAGLRRSRRLR